MERTCLKSGLLSTFLALKLGSSDGGPRAVGTQPLMSVKSRNSCLSCTISLTKVRIGVFVKNNAVTALQMAKQPVAGVLPVDSQLLHPTCAKPTWNYHFPALSEVSFDSKRPGRKATLAPRWTV